MSEIVAREGIALELELRINLEDDSYQPRADLSDCQGVNNPCKLALKFNNRDDLGGEWVVAKDWYGQLLISQLYLDGGYTTDTGGNGSPYTNMKRFENENGTCLLTGDVGCETGDADDLPALQLSIPGSASTFEEDVLFYNHIGRMAVEYGESGYSNDSNGSFLGLLVSDVTQKPAAIDVDGAVKVFGF